MYYRLGLLTIDPPFSPIQKQHEKLSRPKPAQKKKQVGSKKKRKNEQEALYKMDTDNLVNFIQSDRKKKRKKQHKSESLENIIEGKVPPFQSESSDYDLVEQVQLVPLYNNFIEEPDTE